MIEWWGPIIHEYYAGTEGNGFVYCNSEQWLAHPGTVGMPLGCTIHICDDDGEERAAGRDAARSTSRAGSAFEYHNDPDKTPVVAPPEGLEHARRRRLRRRRRLPVPHRPQGVHDHLGRREHLPAGGRERAHHASRRCSTSPCSACPTTSSAKRSRPSSSPSSCRPTTRRPTRSRRELIAFCRSQLADVKCPRSIDFRSELPRHPTGKLYKRLLSDEYWSAAGRSI